MGGGSGGGGSSNTVTQVQDIPLYKQQESLANMNIANSIASTPYQAYQGQTVAGFSGLQDQAMNNVTSAANSYQPYMNAAANMTAQGSQQWSPQTAQQYMSPYVMQALQPQIQALQQQQAQNNLNIGAQATQAGAFGDAQHGVAQSLNNFYAGQNLNNLVSSGMNEAYNTGMQQFNVANQNALSAAQNYGNIGTAVQNAALTGNQNVFDMGTQQQQLNQTQLTEAYNNYLNQLNYPTQMLNLRIAAESGTPTSTAEYKTLAPTNATAANIGAFASLAGAAGNLFGGTSIK